MLLNYFFDQVFVNPNSLWTEKKIQHKIVKIMLTVVTEIEKMTKTLSCIVW